MRSRLHVLSIMHCLNQGIEINYCLDFKSLAYSTMWVDIEILNIFTNLNLYPISQCATKF